MDIEHQEALEPQEQPNFSRQDIPNKVILLDSIQKSEHNQNMYLEADQIRNQQNEQHQAQIEQEQEFIDSSNLIMEQQQQITEDFQLAQKEVIVHAEERDSIQKLDKMMYISQFLIQIQNKIIYNRDETQEVDMINQQQKNTEDTFQLNIQQVDLLLKNDQTEKENDINTTLNTSNQSQVQTIEIIQNELEIQNEKFNNEEQQQIDVITNELVEKNNLTVKDEQNQCQSEAKEVDSKDSNQQIQNLDDAALLTQQNDINTTLNTSNQSQVQIIEIIQNELEIQNEKINNEEQQQIDMITNEIEKQNNLSVKDEQNQCQSEAKEVDSKDSNQQIQSFDDAALLAQQEIQNQDLQEQPMQNQLENNDEQKQEYNSLLIQLEPLYQDLQNEQISDHPKNKEDDQINFNDSEQEQNSEIVKDNQQDENNKNICQEINDNQERNQVDVQESNQGVTRLENQDNIITQQKNNCLQNLENDQPFNNKVNITNIEDNIYKQTEQTTGNNYCDEIQNLAENYFNEKRNIVQENIAYEEKNNEMIEQTQINESPVKQIQDDIQQNTNAQSALNQSKEYIQEVEINQRQIQNENSIQRQSQEEGDENKLFNSTSQNIQMEIEGVQEEEVRTNNNDKMHNEEEQNVNLNSIQIEEDLVKISPCLKQTQQSNDQAQIVEVNDQIDNQQSSQNNVSLEIQTQDSKQFNQLSQKDLFNVAQQTNLEQQEAALIPSLNLQVDSQIQYQTISLSQGQNAFNNHLATPQKQQENVKVSNNQIQGCNNLENSSQKIQSNVAEEIQNTLQPEQIMQIEKDLENLNENLDINIKYSNNQNIGQNNDQEIQQCIQEEIQKEGNIFQAHISGDFQQHQIDQENGQDIKLQTQQQDVLNNEILLQNLNIQQTKTEKITNLNQQQEILQVVQTENQQSLQEEIIDQTIIQNQIIDTKQICQINEIIQPQQEQQINLLNLDEQNNMEIQAENIENFKESNFEKKNNNTSQQDCNSSFEQNLISAQDNEQLQNQESNQKELENNQLLQIGEGLNDQNNQQNLIQQQSNIESLKNQEINQIEASEQPENREQPKEEIKEQITQIEAHQQIDLQDQQHNNETDLNNYPDLIQEQEQQIQESLIKETILQPIEKQNEIQQQIDQQLLENIKQLEQTEVQNEAINQEIQESEDQKGYQIIRQLSEQINCTQPDEQQKQQTDEFEIGIDDTENKIVLKQFIEEQIIEQPKQLTNCEVNFDLIQQEKIQLEEQLNNSQVLEPCTGQNYKQEETNQDENLKKVLDFEAIEVEEDSQNQINRQSEQGAIEQEENIQEKSIQQCFDITSQELTVDNNQREQNNDLNQIQEQQIEQITALSYQLQDLKSEQINQHEENLALENNNHDKNEFKEDLDQEQQINSDNLNIQQQENQIQRNQVEIIKEDTNQQNTQLLEQVQETNLEISYDEKNNQIQLEDYLIENVAQLTEKSDRQDNSQQNQCVQESISKQNYKIDADQQIFNENIPNTQSNHDQSSSEQIHQEQNIIIEEEEEQNTIQNQDNLIKKVVQLIEKSDQQNKDQEHLCIKESITKQNYQTEPDQQIVDENNPNTQSSDDQNNHEQHKQEQNITIEEDQNSIQNEDKKNQMHLTDQHNSLEPQNIIQVLQNDNIQILNKIKSNEVQNLINETQQEQVSQQFNNEIQETEDIINQNHEKQVQQLYQEVYQLQEQNCSQITKQQEDVINVEIKKDNQQLEIIIQENIQSQEIQDKKLSVNQIEQKMDNEEIEQNNQQTPDKQITTVNSQEENTHQEFIQNQEVIYPNIQIDQELQQNYNENKSNKTQLIEGKLDENKLQTKDQGLDNLNVIQITVVDQNYIGQTHQNQIIDIIKDDNTALDQIQQESLNQIQDNQQNIEENQQNDQILQIQEVNQNFVFFQQNIQTQQEMQEQLKENEQDINSRIIVEENVQQEQLVVDIPQETFLQDQNENTLIIGQNVVKENNNQDENNIPLNNQLNEIIQTNGIQTDNLNENLMQDEDFPQENQDQKPKQQTDEQQSRQDMEKCNNYQTDDQQIIISVDEEKQNILSNLKEGEQETDQLLDDNIQTQINNPQEIKTTNPESVVKLQFDLEKHDIESSNILQQLEKNDQIVSKDEELTEKTDLKEQLQNNQDEIEEEQDQIQRENKQTLLEQQQQQNYSKKDQILIEDQKESTEIQIQNEDIYNQLSHQDVESSQLQQQLQNDFEQQELNKQNDSLINSQDLAIEKQKISCQSKLEDEIDSLNNSKSLDYAENYKSKEPVQDQIFENGFYVSPIKKQKNEDNFEDLVSDIIDDQVQEQEQKSKISMQKILVQDVSQNDENEEQNSNKIENNEEKICHQENNELLEDSHREQIEYNNHKDELCLKNGQKVNYIEIIKKYEQENLNESISIINDNLDDITDNNLLYQHLKKISARRSAAKSSTKKLLSEENLDKENLSNNENNVQLDRKSVSKLHQSKSISKQSISSKISSINKMNYDTKESQYKGSQNRERNESIKVNLLNELSESYKNKIQDYEQLAGESKLSNIYPFNLQSRITLYEEEEQNADTQKYPLDVIDDDEEQRLYKFLLNLREPCSFSMIQTRFPYHKPSEILATIEEMKQQKKLNTVQMFLNKKLKYHSVRMEYYDTDQHILNNVGTCDSELEENTDDNNQENLQVEDKTFEFKDINQLEEEELSSYKKSLSIHFAYLEQKKKQLDSMNQINKKQEQLVELMNIGNNLFNRLATIKNQNISQIKQNYGILEQL
ncbi:hypothetical protein ABPG74_012691 [Tetrahymena malaccensis]